MINDLRELVKLRLVFLTGNEVIIAEEILKELEGLIKSAISKKIIRIPAKDEFAARLVWKKIFGEECKEYVKIQDEYVNEETLLILQSYCPEGVTIQILTSIEGARDIDIEEMKQRVNSIKNSGRRIRLLFIGDKQGKAPFHFRYIISRDICYAISTSLKQVGKSKDADLIPISLEEKSGQVEPAFDYWFETPLNKLKEKGIRRMSFDEWVRFKEQ